MIENNRKILGDINPAKQPLLPGFGS